MSSNPPVTYDAILARRDALRRIARSINVHSPSSVVLNDIASEVTGLTGASRSAIALISKSGDMLEFIAVAGEDADQIAGMRIRADESLAEIVLKTGKPLVTQLSDGQTSLETGDPSREGAPDKDKLTLSSIAVVPVSDGEDVIGALFAMNKREGGVFTADDVGLMELLGEYVPLAMTVEASDRSAAESSRELAVLYDAARTVSGSLNVQNVLDSVLDAVCRHLDHEAAVLYLLNDERTHLFVAADRGLNDEEREVQLSSDGKLIAKVLETGKSMLLENVGTEPDFEVITAQDRTKAALLAPIRSRNDILGVMIVTSGQPAVYTMKDVNLLSAVAAQAGIAIGNAWLYEDATRRAEEATELYDLSQHVNATLQLDRILQYVADSVLNLLKVDKFALLLHDRHEDRLVTRICRGVDEERFKAIRPKVGEGIAGWVFEWMTPTAVADVSADARNHSCRIDSEGVVSTICVPMAIRDEVIGVMLAMSSRRRLFTVAEMELLYTIANQAVVATVNSMLYQDARTKSAEMRRYFHRVARALGSALEPKNIPQLLADLAVEVMSADRCAVYKIDGDTLRLHAASGFRASSIQDSTLEMGEGLTGWVARRGKPLAIDNVTEDSRAKAQAWLSREKIVSYLAVPLKLGRKTVGVVEIYTQNLRAFTDDEVKLLAQFSRRARVAERMTSNEE